MSWTPPPVPPKKPAPGALLHAVQNGDITTARRLINENADVNERDNLGNTVLHRAATGGYPDIVSLLIDKGANLDSRNNHGDTPLMSVIPSYAYNREVIVKHLLDKGANMDIRNNDGDTALMLAVMKSRPQIVDMLKDASRTRKRLAEEFAKAAEAKRRAAIAEKQQRLKELAKDRPKPVPRPKPPEAA